MKVYSTLLVYGYLKTLLLSPVVTPEDWGYLLQRFWSLSWIQVFDRSHKTSRETVASKTHAFPFSSHVWCMKFALRYSNTLPLSVVAAFTKRAKIHNTWKNYRPSHPQKFFLAPKFWKPRCVRPLHRTKKLDMNTTLMNFTRELTRQSELALLACYKISSQCTTMPPTTSSLHNPCARKPQQQAMSPSCAKRCFYHVYALCKMGNSSSNVFHKLTSAKAEIYNGCFHLKLHCTRFKN